MRIFSGSYERAFLLKGAVLVFLSLGLAREVPANPSGRAVRAGEIRFQQRGDTLRVLQGSQQGIIDWDTFSIARGETTRFSQPNAQSATLNRVTGESLSRLDGRLLANGRVFLLNSNGIVIGRDGVVDVAGFTASTLDVSNPSFLAGGDLTLRGGSQGAIVNLGSISAFKGDLFLVAATVENAGSLRAPRGTVGLAAGNEVLIRESGSERVFVRGASGGKKSEGVINRGSVEANVAELKAYGGNVYGMAVKNEGRVAATGITREGGQIFLRAGGRSPGRAATGGGKVKSTGTLAASRPGESTGGRVVVDAGPDGSAEVGGVIEAGNTLGSGGDIVILGETVEVFEGSLILADGETGGGSIRIGGGWRGKDPEFANAEHVTVGRGARLSASALGSGDGGEVVVFSQGTLEFRGNLAVRGGLLGGKGGLAELSGQRELFVESLLGQVDLSAPAGKAGTLLIDPLDIQILAGSGGGGISGTTIYANDIAAFLASGSLTIATTDPALGNGDITMATGAAIQWSSGNDLSLLADRDFIMTADTVIDSTGGGAFSVTAARSILLNSGALMTVENGDLTLSANQQVNATAGNFAGITIDGATIQSTGTGGMSLVGLGGTSGDANIGLYLLNGGQISGGTAGVLVIEGTGGAAPGNWNFGVRLESGAAITSSGSNVSVSGYAGDAGTGDSVAGVSLEDSLLEAGGLGNVLVTGDAATAGTSFSKVGLDLQGTAQITSGGGSVQVEGRGGASSGTNRGAGSGVRVNGDGEITAGGSGAVTVYGTGGAGANSSHEGIVVDGAGMGTGLARIGAGNGVTSITAIEGNSLSVALSIGSGSAGRVSTGNNNSINLYLDSLELGTYGVISSGSGQTNIHTRSTGTQIDLGGNDVLSGAPLTLGISDAELNRITAGTLQIGNAMSGSLQVSSAIGFDHHLSLTTGEGAIIDGAVMMGADRDFTLSALGTTDGTIQLTGSNAQLSTTGSGSITLTTVRDIVLLAGAEITTEDGDLTLSANRQTGTTTGDFVGVSLSGATLTSSGMGSIFVSAMGGNNAVGSTSVVDGIQVGEGSLLRSTGTTVGAGGIVLDGIGGSGTLPNAGILVSGAGTTIRSVVGAIELTGVAGDSVSGGGDGLVVDGGAVIRSTGLAPGAATITLTGIGGNGGGGNRGVVVEGNGTLIESAGADIFLTGNGGGQSSGQSNRGILVSAATIKAAGEGRLEMIGNGGPGSSESDGMRLGSGASLEVEDGALVIQGIAGGASGYGVFAAPGSGAIQVSGNGMITLTGSGMNAAGVNLASSTLGGASADSIFVESLLNDLIVLSPTSAAGDITFESQGTVLTGGMVTSGEGEITFDGRDVTINGLVSALDGDVTVIVGHGMSYPGSGGTAAINAGLIYGGSLSFRGGAGGNDTVSYAGFSGTPVIFDFDDLSDIETLIGSIMGNDRLNGPALAGNFLFTGSDVFEIGGVTVSGFEKIVGGAENDIFSFQGSGSLSGTLDGGGGLANQINYGAYTSGAVLNLELKTSSGTPGGFRGIQVFKGSSSLDTVIGSEAASLYQFTSGGEVLVGGFKLSGFDNLLAGSGSDTFLVGPGGGLSGFLNGGGGYDVLDYSTYDTPVSVNLGMANATGFTTITGVESYRGSAFADTFIGTAGNDLFTINAMNSGFVNGLAFSSFEYLRGVQGDDRFLFQNQATVTSVEGGQGNDLLEIDDRNLGGTNTYTITSSQISRNPTYLFSGIKSIKLLLGPGDDTVITSANGMMQTFDGGAGYDYLDLGADIFLSANPMTLGNSTIYHRGFEAPFPPGTPTGEVLQVQSNNVNRPQRAPGAQVADQFSPDQGTGLAADVLLQALNQQEGNAFSAVLNGPNGLLQLDGENYRFGVAVGLDGSFTPPPPELFERLRENLRPDGWAELADAIGFDGPMTLIPSDGAFSIDLESEVPPDLLVILANGLSPESARELFAALEMAFFFPLTAAEGAISISVLAIPLDEATRAILLEQISEAAFTELSDPLGE